MPVAVCWDNPEKTIVRYDFEGSWMWEELYPAYDEAIVMELSVSHRVDVILDLRRAKLFPKNLLTHMKGFSDRQPPNIGLSVLVTTNRFIHSMYNVGTKFYAKIQHYFRIAETPDEAYAMIAKDRQQAS